MTAKDLICRVCSIELRIIRLHKNIVATGKCPYCEGVHILYEVKPGELLSECVCGWNGLKSELLEGGRCPNPEHAEVMDVIAGRAKS